MNQAAVLFFLLLNSFFGNPNQSADMDAADLIKKSLAAMGGKENLEKIESLGLKTIGHTYLLEQSERPEGPWIVNYEQTQQVRDYSKRRLFLKKENKNNQQPEWQESVLLYEEETLAMKLNEQQILPARKGGLEEINALFDLSLEQLLLNAVGARDLELTSDTLLQDVKHHVLTFTHENVPVSLFLNSNTSLPTMLRITKSLPQDLMWSSWGEVKTEIYFSFWQLTPEGINYPMQYNIFRNGQLWKEYTVLSLKFNEKASEMEFTIPEEVKRAFASQPPMDFYNLPLGRPDKPTKEIAPGILLIPGYWNLSLVEQEDGVVLLEAPISGGYAKKALAEALNLFPGKKVKSVVSTSDAWPHIAGVRECALQQLPIFTLDLNETLLAKMISAPGHSGQPIREPEKLIRKVSQKTLLGSGKNRMEVYPISGESSERMMMVYFPEYRLLYASDLVQQNRDGSFFLPGYLAELVTAVNREGLQVENIFAMHTDIIPYSRILEEINQK